MKNLRNLSWVIFVVLSIILVVFIKNENALRLLPGLIGVFAMLAIAITTFIKMDESTKETVGTILDASQKQIDEFSHFTKELKTTNNVLDNVAKSLDIVSKDVVVQQQQSPRLNVSFRGGNTQIRVKAGDECDLEFELHNSGLKNANNPTWSIFLPPSIGIVNAGSFVIVTQGPETRYPNYTGLFKQAGTMTANGMWNYVAKIKTELTDLGLKEIPFRCSCDNIARTDGKLIIDLSG